jgi:hypothetical protein
MLRLAISFLIGFTLMWGLLGTRYVFANDINCSQIKLLVAEHGRVKAIVWAREHGYTWAQINEARKCLR